MGGGAEKKKKDKLESDWIEDKDSRITDHEEEALAIDPNKVMKLLSSVGDRQEQDIQELEDEMKMLQTLATRGLSQICLCMKSVH